MYMRGFTPRPNHAPLYMGLRPKPQRRRWYGHRPYPDRGGVHPTSRSYFGKKNPKNPKKPNCIGFRLSSKDSKQGYRRQPCFCVRRTRCGAATARRPTRPPPHRRTPRPIVSAVPVPVGCRSFRFPRAPHRTPNNTFPHRISRLSAKVLKLMTFSFLS